MKRCGGFILFATVVAGLWLFAGFSQTAAEPRGTIPPMPPVVRLAVIGDYGANTTGERAVADMVRGWQPDAILTTGDNNYPAGAAATIDANIGQYYHDFIYLYAGAYGPGADGNRFFPVLGNHDWMAAAGTPPAPQPYQDYFSLPEGPGEERYYDVRLGVVHLFAIDSDPHEPDGITQSSRQAAWLRDGLAASDAPWKVVFMHHPPFSSSSVHGSTVELQWPYRAWGASAVFAGHDHTYERLVHDGVPYFVVGHGGAALYGFGAALAESQVRYNANHGAVVIEATTLTMTVRMLDITGVERDAYAMQQPAHQFLPLVRP